VNTNELNLISALVLSVVILCTGYQKEKPKNFTGIENISFENYPKVDGSTSSSMLNL
jgi:hypothetical protein